MASQTSQPIATVRGQYVKELRLINDPSDHHIHDRQRDALAAQGVPDLQFYELDKICVITRGFSMAAEDKLTTTIQRLKLCDRWYVLQVIYTDLTRTKQQNVGTKHAEHELYREIAADLVAQLVAMKIQRVRVAALSAGGAVMGLAIPELMAAGIVIAGALLHAPDSIPYESSKILTPVTLCWNRDDSVIPVDPHFYHWAARLGAHLTRGIIVPGTPGEKNHEFDDDALLEFM